VCLTIGGSELSAVKKLRSVFAYINLFPVYVYSLLSFAFTRQTTLEKGPRIHPLIWVNYGTIIAQGAMIATNAVDSLIFLPSVLSIGGIEKNVSILERCKIIESFKIAHH